MKDFDATFGTAAEKTGREVTELNAEKATEPEEEFSWGSIFQDELTDAPQWHQKYDHLVVGKFQWSGAVTAYLVGDGDQDGVISKLFVEGLETTVIEGVPDGDAFLTYGAGVWLQDNKASQHMEEDENFKGVLLEFKDDAAHVVLEARVSCPCAMGCRRRAKMEASCPCGASSRSAKLMAWLTSTSGGTRTRGRQL